jgi:hypothetical protein
MGDGHIGFGEEAIDGEGQNRAGEGDDPQRVVWAAPDASTSTSGLDDLSDRDVQTHRLG